jgi:hypothetical protein
MNPEHVLGNSFAVFAGFTLLCMASCGALIGISLAHHWQPARKLLPYALVLGVLDRFLGYALFGSDVLSATGFVIDTYFILMAALLAYRCVLARLLVRQYPWMYRRFLIFGWRSVRVEEAIGRPR